jgi:GTPase SAR1 family protein
MKPGFANPQKMNYESNEKLQLAYDFVQYTGRNIFLTGRAGTGKTTFLHHLRQHSSKRLVVTAPTGVAAINAAGVTLHSFFQLPFGPQLPGFNATETVDGVRQAKEHRFNKEKINIIRSMDLLVIDEISMVRADLLDGVDRVLRRFRNRDLPFGGVQLLMIGDLQQLSPVVKEDEWRLLKNHYETPYFFSSLALKKTDYVTIELQHVFRQKDKDFVDLLNKIRDNKMDKAALDMLQSRYQPDFNADDTGHIILTTHNHKARQINESRLHRLKGKAYTFAAEIWGNFPEYTYPTEPQLTLKEGAQVMFVKNDPSPDKLFYNGKIGKVVEIGENNVAVLCEGDAESIEVVPLTWEKTKYTLDNETKEIKETVEGTFTQLPLKTAWAITIHKSQGLTFEKAIIDAQEAFAHGQVYVALSRCKSLEGLILSTPVTGKSICNDATIDRFTRYFEEHQPDAKELEASRKAFEKQLITGLFNFNTLQRRLYYTVKLSHENEGSLTEDILEKFHDITRETKTKITDVGEKFRVQLTRLLSENDHVEENNALQERIKKGARYFSEHLNTLVLDKLQDMEVETDNKTVKKKMKNALDNLLQESIFKTACLEACHNGFDMQTFLKAQAEASIEENTGKRSRKKKAPAANATLKYPELYERIKQWRNAKVAETGMQFFMVLPLKTMRALAEELPVSKAALKAIHGFGKKKIELFGDEILEIITRFTEEKGITPPVFSPPEEKKKKPKKPTRQISFEMWKEGKSIPEIAEERGLAVSTIEGHLAKFVRSGDIAVESLVDTEKIKKITAYFLSHPESESLTEAKAALDDAITFGELRFVLEHLRHEGKILPS